MVNKNILTTIVSYLGYFFSFYFYFLATIDIDIISLSKSSPHPPKRIPSDGIIRAKSIKQLKAFDNYCQIII